MKYLLGRDFLFPNYLPRFPRRYPFDVIRLEAEVEIDLENREVKGAVRYRVKAKEELSLVELDAVEMEILGASTPYYYDGRALSIEHKLAKGEEGVFEVKYRARPRKGMYFVLPDRRHNYKVPMAWTQGESEDNRYWIPLPDSPNIKFPWTLTVVVKKPLTAVSNGSLKEVKDLGDKRAFVWDMPWPMSPYLLAIAAGDFESYQEKCGDVVLEYYVPRGQLDKARFSFYHTCDVMKFFEEYLGPYPYGRYAQIVVQEFVYGGMENTTATILTDWTLHDKHAHCPYSEFPCPPDEEEFSSDPLIAHEMAHQWTGDLVTAKDWAHIAINESFATFLEALWTERSKGRDEYLYEIYGNFKAYLNEYNNRYARPIVINIYGTPEEVFDRHAYEKGSVVLHMLRSLLGDEAFKRGLRLFLERHKFKNADIEDLRKAFEEAAGVDLEWFWRQFFYSAGHPSLRVSLAKDPPRLTIEQTQPDDSYPLYTLPLEIDVVGEDGKRERITLNLNEKRIDVSIKRPRYVCIDPELKLLKALELNIPLEAAGAMLEDEHVYCRLQAVEALRKNGSRRAVELLAKALRDKFWGVAAEAARALGDIGTLEAVNALTSAYRGAKSPKVRRAIIEALGSARRREAAEFLDRVLHDPAESYYVRAEAAKALGKSKWEFAEFSLRKALEYGGHLDVIKRGAIEGLAELGTDDALKAVLSYTDEAYPTWIRMTAVQSLSKFGPRREVLETLQRALRDENYRIRAAAVTAALDLMDPRLLPALQDRADNDVDGRIRRMAKEAAEKIKKAMERGAEYQKLREEVERLRDEYRRLLDRLARLEK
ncbi:MAG: M1 family aminopeptidase [Thermoproteus sp. AZ2]|uniref:M1 family aminopeptidase n=1 Tax=Thermoproteus sp. AZ2 TaxID=1609232 RepID=A0ACC6UY93_9CREN